MMTQLVGKHEAAVFIGLTKPESIDHLLMVGSFQNGQNKGSNSDGAALAVLGGDDLILSLCNSDFCRQHKLTLIATVARKNNIFTLLYAYVIRQNESKATLSDLGRVALTVIQLHHTTHHRF